MPTAIALLRRPSVVASLAVHGILAFGLLQGGAPAGGPRGALVLPFLADEVHGPEDNPPGPPAPTEPRDIEAVLAQPPLSEQLPPQEEPLELPPDGQPVAAELPPPPPRVPPALRTRPPVFPPVAARLVAAPVPPQPAPPPHVASRAGTGSVVDASPEAGNRAPDYPSDARARGWEGTVRVDLLVAADGTVASVRLFASSGYPVLDAAAVAAAGGWRFAPRRVDGVPTPEWVRVPVVFRLR